MINIKTIKQFSIYDAPITSIEKITDIYLSDVHDIIIGDELKKETENYRKGNGNKNEEFPFVQFSGIFKGRKDNDLVTHSNLLAIDIDNLKNIDEVKAKLKNDKHIVLLYTTPSNKGLRAVVVIDLNKGSHLDYFLCAERYFKQKYDITIDPNCKNVSRASYLCYDPGAHMYHSVIDFPLEEKQPTKLKGLEEKNYDKELNQQKVENCIAQIEEQEIDITNGYENWLKIGFGLVTEFGEQGREYYHNVSQFNVDYDEEICNKQYNACLSNNNENITIATFFHYCKKYGIKFSPIKKEVKSIIGSNNSIVTARQRLEIAKKQPPIKLLFGNFWATNQIGILFGDTGLGKSILTVQLADKISKGTDLFGLKNENTPLKVLLYDFELSDKQFEKRYSDEKGNLYEFDDYLLFKRFDIEDFYLSREKNNKLEFDEWLFCMIENDVKITKSKVLIIDNITFLNSESTQDANVASNIMRRLKQLKDKFKLSILVIAHTPKVPKNEPITKNHLAGSKNLSNFADSIFCIGKSGISYDYCYLKQIKARDGIELFNEDNVLTIRKEQKKCMLQFHFKGFTNEEDHFVKKEDKETLKEIAKQKYKELESYRKVAKIMGVSHQTIKRWIEEA